MKECSCNLIDWTGKDGKYIHIESGEIYDSQKHGALDCQTKVKEGIFNLITAPSLFGVSPISDVSIAFSVFIISVFPAYAPTKIVTIS